MIPTLRQIRATVAEAQNFEDVNDGSPVTLWAGVIVALAERLSRPTIPIVSEPATTNRRRCTMPPTISQLAQTTEDAFTAFAAAQATADASAKQAAADGAARDASQVTLDGAISDLVAAARALDPSPVPVPVTGSQNFAAPNAR